MVVFYLLLHFLFAFLAYGLFKGIRVNNYLYASVEYKPFGWGFIVAMVIFAPIALLIAIDQRKSASFVGSKAFYFRTPRSL